MPDAPTDLAALAAALLDHSLPKAEWTHEAHLGATLYLLAQRSDLDLDSEMAGIIRSYNEAVGTPNTDQSGYHETLTRFFLRLLRRVLAEAPDGETLAGSFARLLGSPRADRAFPLRFYSRERLFSVEARRGFVEPDLAPLDF